MQTHTQPIAYMGPLRKITAALLLGWFAALSAGCTPQLSAGYPDEMTKAGEIIRAVDANGAPTSNDKLSNCGRTTGGPPGARRRSRRTGVCQLLLGLSVSRYNWYLPLEMPLSMEQR